MLRSIGGAVAGVIGWFVLVTIIDLALRYGWHDYALVEKAMAFTLPMMVARLAMSAVASIGAGYGVARIDRGGWAALGSGVVLLLMFLPVHYKIWDRFPIWYHLTFLISLPLLGWAGGRLRGAASAT